MNPTSGESSPLMAARQPRIQSSLRRIVCSPDSLIFYALCLSYLGWAAFSVWTFLLLAHNSSERVFLPCATRIAAMLMFASVPISIADILQHLFHYSSRTQRLYVRILLLPPIYAIESYLALAVPSAHFVLETLRETYECIALLAVYDLARETLGADADIVNILMEGPSIYAERLRIEGIAGAGGVVKEVTATVGTCTTEAFIFSCVDGSFWSCSPKVAEKKTADFIDASGERRVRLIFPFHMFASWRADASFLNRCSWGVAQYVVVRVVTSLVTLVLEDRDQYGNGSWDAANPSLWLTLFINTSQLWALWCLVFFAATLWPALKPLKPLNKFLLVKVVVFGFWWQSLCLEIVASAGWLRRLEAQSPKGRDDMEAAAILQDVLITAEIVLITIFHHYNFGLADFLRPELSYALLWNELRARGRADLLDKGQPSSGVALFGRMLEASLSPFKSPLSAAMNEANSASPTLPLPHISDPSPELSQASAYADIFMLDVLQESAAVLSTATTAATGVISTTLVAVRRTTLNLVASSKLGPPPSPSSTMREPLI